MFESVGEMAATVGSELRSTDASLASVTTGGTRDLQVDKDNVLKVAKIIQDVLDTEGQHVTTLLADINIMRPGDDPVSKEAAEAWQERLVTNPDSHCHRILDYINGLHQLVDNLKVTAQQYGYSEAEIAHTLNKVTPK